MLSNFKSIAIRYYTENQKMFLILLMAFTTGIAAGAFTVNGLSTIQRDELINYFHGFLQLFENQEVDGGELMAVSLADNLKIAGVLWFLGMTIIGIPFIIVIMVIKGFITGFSSGFIINAVGFKGILFTLFGMLPKEIILVPCFIALGVNGISFSLKMIRSRSVKKALKSGLKTEFIKYCLVTLLLCGFIFLGVLIEAYITPAFIRIISPILVK